MMNNAAKYFDILATSLSVLHNYLIVQDLYLYYSSKLFSRFISS